MIQIRNLMFQPLTFHLIGDDSSIHLKARECRIVSECQLSDEIRAAASRGFVSITPIHETRSQIQRWTRRNSNTTWFPLVTTELPRDQRKESMYDRISFTRRLLPGNRLQLLR